MAELADALDSGSNDRKVVEVQVLLPAPKRVFLTNLRVGWGHSLSFVFLRLFVCMSRNCPALFCYADRAFETYSIIRIDTANAGGKLFDGRFMTLFSPTKMNRKR